MKSLIIRIIIEVRIIVMEQWFRKRTHRQMVNRIILEVDSSRERVLYLQYSFPDSNRLLETCVVAGPRTGKNSVYMIVMVAFLGDFGSHSVHFPKLLWCATRHVACQLLKQKQKREFPRGKNFSCLDFCRKIFKTLQPLTETNENWKGAGSRAE